MMSAVEYLPSFQHASTRVDGDLMKAITRTIAYADVFDYPLTIDEIHRRLVGTPASRAAVEHTICAAQAASRPFISVCNYYMLRGRGSLVATRRRRAQVAARLWPAARRYGARIARLPFVRMVAVTGALAVDNVEPDADIDYLIVTKPGRLWLCRAMIVAMVRIAARSGHVLCPNYLITEDALEIRERSLYTAHELAQMVPLAGWPTYRRMRLINQWMADYLPNAPLATDIDYATTTSHTAKVLAEAILNTAAGGWIEQWEMQRKIQKLMAQATPGDEIAFCADWCKGHFGRHGTRTLGAFDARLAAIGGYQP